MHTHIHMDGMGWDNRVCVVVLPLPPPLSNQPPAFRQDINSLIERQAAKQGTEDFLLSLCYVTTAMTGWFQDVMLMVMFVVDLFRYHGMYTNCAVSALVRACTCTCAPTQALCLCSWSWSWALTRASAGWFYGLRLSLACLMSQVQSQGLLYALFGCGQLRWEMLTDGEGRSTGFCFIVQAGTKIDRERKKKRHPQGGRHVDQR